MAIEPDNSGTDTLDDAIARGIATEEDRCVNDECEWCHPDTAPQVAPDQQTYAEVFANLNNINVGILLSPERTIDGLRQKLDLARATITMRGEEIEALIAERDAYIRRVQEVLIASGEWEKLFEGAIRIALEKRRDNLILADRAAILESAVRTYAEHIWNDIEQRLAGVDHE